MYKLNCCRFLSISNLFCNSKTSGTNILLSQPLIVSWSRSLSLLSSVYCWLVSVWVWFVYYRELLPSLKPSTQLNINVPTLAEGREVVRVAWGSTAPRQSGVPYKVYKHCPRLLQRLWRITRVVQQRVKVAKQWHHAEAVWIPKEGHAKDIMQFCIISLLSMKGKIFFNMVANCLSVEYPNQFH